MRETVCARVCVWWLKESTYELSERMWMYEQTNRLVCSWPWKEDRRTENKPSFWSSDWFCKQSTNVCAILLDFRTGSFDVVFWVLSWFVGRTRFCTQLTKLRFYRLKFERTEQCYSNGQMNSFVRTTKLSLFLSFLALTGWSNGNLICLFVCFPNLYICFVFFPIQQPSHEVRLLGTVHNINYHKSTTTNEKLNNYKQHKITKIQTDLKETAAWLENLRNNDQKNKRVKRWVGNNLNELMNEWIN